MKSAIRRILWTAIPVVIGYLIAQYLGGNWTDNHMLALFVCIGVFLCLAVGKFVRKIIYFPINLLRKLVLFR